MDNPGWGTKFSRSALRGVVLATSSHLFIAWSNQTIAIYFCDGWLERRTVDSSKIQTNFLRAM